MERRAFMAMISGSFLANADAATSLRSASGDFDGPGVSSRRYAQVDRLELRSELRR
jgi:hypothetical protein